MKEKSPPLFWHSEPSNYEVYGEEFESVKDYSMGALESLLIRAVLRKWKTLEEFEEAIFDSFHFIE